MQIEAVLSFLENDLELKGDDLKKVVKSFPEVINCSIEGRLKANIDYMQKVRPASAHSLTVLIQMKCAQHC